MSDIAVYHQVAPAFDVNGEQRCVKCGKVCAERDGHAWPAGMVSERRDGPVTHWAAGYFDLWAPIPCQYATVMQ